MKSIRCGVSNWQFVFNDGEVINLKEVMKQTFIYDCENLPFIELENAVIRSDVIDKIKQNKNEVKVKEQYRRYEFNGGGYTEGVDCVDEYLCKIKSISIVCQKDEVSVFNIVLSVCFEED